VLTLGGALPIITGYCDSDWASDTMGRKSVSGFIIYLGNSPVCWYSKSQTVVALSSAEAEFMAMTPPSQNIVWIRSMLSQIGWSSLKWKYASTLWSDNQAALAMSQNPVHYQRTKHVAIKYYYIRDLVSYGVIVTDYIRSEDNCADLMTKPLGHNKVEKHKRKCLGHNNVEHSSKKVKTVQSDEYV
jgi:hypothetical protein